MENSPPIRKEPPLKRLNLRNWEKNCPEIWRRPFFFFFFFGDHLILGGKNVWVLDFGRKITLNFGEDLFFFFGDHLILGEKNLWIFDLSETFRLKFGQTVWNWFKVNENSSQRRLHTSHSFKIAPPPFSKSWLRACSCFSYFSKQRWSRVHNVRGQGPTFRGQTLSRPRTGMIKAKDQGHNFFKL